MITLFRPFIQFLCIASKNRVYFKRNNKFGMDWLSLTQTNFREIYDCEIPRRLWKPLPSKRVLKCEADSDMY